jgi:amino-acid N-acetyltransferase
MIRRHAKSDREMHFGPALRVVSGNYIAAKRRGILEGVDFGYTGEVGWGGALLGGGELLGAEG